MPELHQPKPKFIPPQDQDRSAEELDPQYWERMLAEQSDPDRPVMSHAEEELGVHYGAAGAEEVEFEPLNETDRTMEDIARAIASEPGNRLHSFPRSQADLERSLHDILTAVSKEKRDQVKVGVHNSCVTGDACVYAIVPTADEGVETLHLSLADMDKPLDIEILQEHVEQKLLVTFKPPK